MPSQNAVPSTCGNSRPWCGKATGPSSRSSCIGWMWTGSTRRGTSIRPMGRNWTAPRPPAWRFSPWPSSCPPALGRTAGGVWAGNCRAFFLGCPGDRLRVPAGVSMPPTASELLKTPLNAAHRGLNAKMVDFGGWDMPVQYPAGILAEHEAVRTKAGLFDVSHMGEIRVKGPGALALVEHLTPNAVSKLALGQVHYTAFLYENGTFVDDLLVYREGEQEFLQIGRASCRER